MIQKKYYSSCNFVKFVIKTLDPDPVLDPDRYSAKMLDKDPNPESRHWGLLILQRKRLRAFLTVHNLHNNYYMSKDKNKTVTEAEMGILEYVRLLEMKEAEMEFLNGIFSRGFWA